jgi:hypothetical protein
MYIKALIIAIALCSCSSYKIKQDFIKYKQISSLDGKIPTKEEISAAKSTIAVADFDNGCDLCKSKNAGNTIASNIEATIRAKGLAKSIDRKILQKLTDEIKLREISGRKIAPMPQIADYAIVGSVDDLSFSATRTWFGMNKYTVHVQAKAKLIDLSNMNEITSSMFDDTISKREPGMIPLNPGDKYPIYIPVPLKSFDDGLVANGIKDATKKIKKDLLQNIASKGFVIEKKGITEDGKLDKVIVQVTLGSVDGIKYGDKVDFNRKNERKSEFDEEYSYITSGYVTDMISPNSAWVTLDVNNESRMLTLGDIVTRKIDLDDDSFFDFIPDSLI